MAGASQSRDTVAGAVQRLQAGMHGYGTGYATPAQLALTKRMTGERDESDIAVRSDGKQKAWDFPLPPPPRRQK